MKYPLSAKELSKLIKKDYEGINFIGYKFKIKNSPVIRVYRESRKIISCTCKAHSIHGDKPVSKIFCRFTSAYMIWKEKNTIYLL